jgi:hypothetical protein
MFFSIYQKPDVRVTATRWINENLPPDSIILVEAGNMLEVPLSGNQQRIGFDFYNFEENPSLKQQFPQLLEKSDYFIVQSRRMFANFQRLPEQFPKTARFYDLLFGGQLGFEKIEEFNAYPQFSILKLRLFVPDEKAEETWSVFDHPVIRIYKKVHYFSESFYEAILQL